MSDMLEGQSTTEAGGHFRLTPSLAALGLGLLIGAPVAFVLATVLTTVWFNRVYIPRIAGED